MVSNVNSCMLTGVDAEIVKVECDVSRGMPSLTIVGLPDASVRESRERLRAAIINSGLEYPGNKRITVNLSPAGTRKEGTHLDLAIALSFLISTGGRSCRLPDDLAVIGELSLDGRVNGVSGAMAMCIGAKKKGITRVMVPEDNIKSVSIVEGMSFYPVRSLDQAFGFICGQINITEIPGCRPSNAGLSQHYEEDYLEVRGRNEAKRAIVIGVSGFHNILMTGPPGCGKSMLAKRICTVMPDMSYDEMLEVTKIYSISGASGENEALVWKRPFRSPAGNVSVSAMLGGGSGIPKPGEITLSHLGALFLDEMPEMKRDVLEALRQPMEDESVTISRSLAKVTYPSKFLLIGARNPCPCGFLNDASHECTCTASQIKKYSDKLSGPLMDRIDIFIDMAPIDLDKVRYRETDPQGERDMSSEDMRRLIERASEMQRIRYDGSGISYNSQLRGRMLKKYCVLDEAAEALFDAGCISLKVSLRGRDKILKIARTIADIEGKAVIEAAHVAEALQYRRRDE